MFIRLGKSKENLMGVYVRVKLQTVIIYQIRFNTFGGSLNPAGLIIGCTFFVVYRWMGL